MVNRTQIYIVTRQWIWQFAVYWEYIFKKNETKALKSIFSYVVILSVFIIYKIHLVKTTRKSLLIINY